MNRFLTTVSNLHERIRSFRMIVYQIMLAILTFLRKRWVVQKCVMRTPGTAGDEHNGTHRPAQNAINSFSFGWPIQPSALETRFSWTYSSGDQTSNFYKHFSAWFNAAWRKQYPLNKTLKTVYVRSKVRKTRPPLPSCIRAATQLRVVPARGSLPSTIAWCLNMCGSEVGGPSGVYICVKCRRSLGIGLKPR